MYDVSHNQNGKLLWNDKNHCCNFKQFSILQCTHKQHCDLEK